MMGKSMVRRHRMGVSAAILLGAYMVACSSNEQSTSTVAAPAIVIASTATTVPPTLAPTNTPVPTTTPVPTNTPIPAATVTAAQVNAPAPSIQQAGAVTITDAQATDLATQALASNPDALPVPLANPRVTFTRDYIQLAADVSGQNARLQVQGTPQVENDQVHFKLTSLKLNGLEVPFYRTEVESAINGIFARMLTDKHIKSVRLGDGTLTVLT